MNLKKIRALAVESKMCRLCIHCDRWGRCCIQTNEVETIDLKTKVADNIQGV